MTVHAKYVRYRDFSMLRHAKKFYDFLTAQAARLSGSGAGVTVTPANATNSFNKVTHGYANGHGPVRMKNSGGALPTGVAANTDYWVSAVDADNFKLHSSKADSLVPQNEVAFTDDGSGTQSTHEGATEEVIFDAMLAGKTADQIRSITSLDNL